MVVTYALCPASLWAGLFYPDICSYAVYLL